MSMGDFGAAPPPWETTTERPNVTPLPVPDTADVDEPPPPDPVAYRVPPSNLQAEQSLLGAMLLSRDAIAAAIAVVEADDFYKPAHGDIFDAIRHLAAEDQPADSVTVADLLERRDLLDGIGGPHTLVTLMANCPATSNAPRYARLVLEHSVLRGLIGVAGEIAELGYEQPESIDDALCDAAMRLMAVAERWDRGTA